MPLDIFERSGLTNPRYLNVDVIAPNDEPYSSLGNSLDMYSTPAETYIAAYASLPPTSLLCGTDKKYLNSSKERIFLTTIYI